MRTSVLPTAVLITAAVMAPALRAQNIDKAIDAYKSKSYDEAAVRFFEVLRFDSSEGNIVEAEYGIAQSLLRLGLAMPAVRYYENIIGAGPTHPYYLKAFEGLLEAAEILQDDLIVPAILDKKYSNALAKLAPESLQRIHYLLGERLYKMQKRGEALDFLRTVGKENEAYAKAQYLIGMTFLGKGAGGPTEYDKAIEAFDACRSTTQGRRKEAAQDLYQLATLALARIYYEMGAQLPAEEEKDETRPNQKKQELLRKAIELYSELPRFSPYWGDALFERAWAHSLIPVQGTNARGEPVVKQEYGKALGALHSIHAPYFSSGYWPESFILKAIIYYYNCHFDRVYKALQTLQEEYEPLNKLLQDIIEKPGRADGDWFDLLLESLAAKKSLQELQQAKADELLIPDRVARHLTQDPQWRKLTFFLDELARETAVLKDNRTLSGGELGNEILMLIDENTRQFRGVAGRWVHHQLAETQNYLQSFVNRAVIVKLETESAEKDWLEMGRNIDKGLRPRLPRPYIPSDKYQYFTFNSEYWADELGFYEYSIRTECYE